MGGGRADGVVGDVERGDARAGREECVHDDAPDDPGAAGYKDVGPGEVE